MYTKNDECIVEIRNVDSVNMSNWQITHTIDTLTIVNNKFDILDKVNMLIAQGIDKRNIFVTDKSFLISTNYKTYFEKGNIINSDSSSIVKAANIGRIITMEYNSEIIDINSLFEYYKKISSLITKHHRIRLRSWVLDEAYDTLKTGDINVACEKLTDGAVKQVMEIYERYLQPDYQKRDDLIQRIKRMQDKELPKILSKNVDIACKCKKKFENYFERVDRPIVGVYHPKQRTFEIINADQMYKNGEESKNRIKLRSVSKNSPVLITLGITGVMLATIAYLAYREHKVDDSDIFYNMTDMPQTNSEAIHNIFSSQDGSLIMDECEFKIVDPFIETLAEKNMEKLERVTNKSRVCIEIHNHINIHM